MVLSDNNKNIQDFCSFSISSVENITSFTQIKNTFNKIVGILTIALLIILNNFCLGNNFFLSLNTEQNISEF